MIEKIQMNRHFKDERGIKMIKNFIGGMAVGIANIIPGVSGGTIMVLLGIFDKLMESISNLFKINIPFKERIESLKFIIQIGIGLVIGLVGFAKILDILFQHFSNQTLCLFSGLIVFSIPMVKKTELKGSINWLWFIIGIAIISILVFLNPGETNTIVTLDDLLNININFNYILILIIVGAISGATMLFPGISGSMVLLVIGYYYTYKSYVSNVTSFEPKVLIPLIFIAIGVILGIIGSAKLTNFLLKKYNNKTMSLILGLILMSGICIIPVSDYTIYNIIPSIICFILGAVLVTTFDKLRTSG